MNLEKDGRIERIMATQRTHVDDMLFTPFVSDRFWSRYLSRGHYDEAWLLEDVRENWDALTAEKRIEFLVIERLYMLCNQGFHGSTTSTVSGTTGRPQVVQGSTIMHHIVPLFSLVARENSDNGWEPPYSPGNPLKDDGFARRDRGGRMARSDCHPVTMGRGSPGALYGGHPTHTTPWPTLEPRSASREPWWETTPHG